jgi:hypothetical protein
MQFQNPHARTLEGTLQFPLAEGAVVTGYAVESEGGRLLHAIPVEKEAARVAFEEAVRTGHEAGLAEVAKGSNVFNTRVYPIGQTLQRQFKCRTPWRWSLPRRWLSQPWETGLWTSSSLTSKSAAQTGLGLLPLCLLTVAGVLQRQGLLLMAVHRL